MDNFVAIDFETPRHFANIIKQESGYTPMEWINMVTINQAKNLLRQPERVNDKADQLPEWFIRGVEAAMLAPTAINQQKFVFILCDNNKVEAKARFTLLNNYAATDLGIVKYHFEVTAGKENFEWLV